MKFRGLYLSEIKSDNFDKTQCMDSLSNPYTPNAGAEPQAVVGRDDQLKQFVMLLARLARRCTEQSMIITGLRGVGKTVLLHQFRGKALAQDWAVVEMEVQKHDEAAFRRVISARLRTALHELSPKAQWTDAFKHAVSVLKSFTLSVDPEGQWTAGLDVEPAEGFADHGDLSMDLTDLLVAVGAAAQDKGRGVVLLVDEVQFLESYQFEALIAALHKTIQRKLPITMVGAGLPQVAELAGDAKSYAERLFKFPEIGYLDEDDARLAFSEPAADEEVTFEAAALDLALEITGCYPYFIQELGYAIWESASTSPVTADDVREAWPLYEGKLDSSFFRVRLDRATALQQAYLRAMAELGPDAQRVADVAGVMGRTSQNIAPTRKALIDTGLLYAPKHGYAAFTVPHFDQFMRRTIPELKVPAPRR